MRNYNITGEFANVYTRQMFEKSMANLSKWDGSNAVLVNLDPNKFPPGVTSDLTGWVDFSKDCLLTKFNASGNILEIEFEVSIRQCGYNDPESFIGVGPAPYGWKVYIKYEYLGKDQIKRYLEETVLETNVQSYEETSTITEKKFSDEIWMFSADWIKSYGGNSIVPGVTFEVKLIGLE